MSDLPSLWLAAVPTAGGYFSVAKLILLLPPLLAWLWVSAWVDKDAARIHSSRVMWSTMIFGAGLAGLMIWLLVPFYFAGLGIFVILVATVGMLYVSHHNTKVIPQARVLTAEYFAGLFKHGEKRHAKVVTRLKVYDNTGKPVPPPDDETSEGEKLGYNQMQDLLYDVMWRRASEVDLAPTTNCVTIRLMIDGVLVNHPHMEKAEAEGVIDEIKKLAGMDMEDRRRPQSGKISVDLAGKPIDITLVAAGSTSGQRLQMKIVQESVRTQVEELGMSKDVLARLRQLNTQPDGLIIVASKPGNGLTSTLYSLLRDHDAYIKQLVTVEQKPQVDIENVSQHPYKNAAEMPKVLSGVLRRDPDVVMVDTCLDATSAEVVLEAAREKKLLLGLPAGDAFTALAKWIKVVGHTSVAVQSLQGVLCQVLLRKLCPACREAYKPDPEMLRKANLPMDKIDKFFRPPSKPLTDEKGNPYTCPTCQGSGYLGRTAAFELLEINSEIRQLISGGANLTQIKSAARKNKMLYLQEQALRLVIEGITSIQEVIRVTKQKQEQEQSARGRRIPARGRCARTAEGIPVSSPYRNVSNSIRQVADPAPPVR
jgi:general secretion pathway protein E